MRLGDIVIADNLSSHKDAQVAAIIESFGAHILYFPPHSPDLNPVELVLSILKSLLRAAAARSLDSLTFNIGHILDLFSPQHCLNFLRHCHYSASSFENALGAVAGNKVERIGSAQNIRRTDGNPLEQSFKLSTRERWFRE